MVQGRQPGAGNPRAETFAALLRRYRRAAGLTQEELAGRAGISALTIRNAEREQHTPQPPNFLALARALGIAREERPDDFAAFEAAWRAARATTLGLGTGSGAVADAGATTPHNLPAEVTSFVGRAGELRDLGEQLARPEVRLLALTGPGGVGKTRLALRLARQALAAFPDGIWFVPLAALTDPALVLPTLARALGVAEAPGVPLIERLGARLAGRRTLLILDNFEGVLAAVPAATGLLPAAAGLTLLVTSRAALRAYGEHERPVPPLPVPAPDAEGPSTADSPAIALFRDRATAARADFALDAATARAVAEVCARLDGLPLAIELAAARVRRFAPGELLARFPSRLDLGADGPRDVAARQRTLRATIAWSEALLAPDERQLFARLAVFSGGWTDTAARAICGDAGEAAMARRLDALVDANLIHFAPAVPGVDRFGILETVREYAAERLAATGEETAIRRAHAAYFLALARTERPYPGGHLAAWLLALDPERDNLRAALAWARDSGEATLFARLAGRLWPYWHERGLLTEGLAWLEAALPPASGGTDELRAPLLAGMVAILVNSGAYRRAGEVGEEALRACRATGDLRNEAIVLGFLGSLAQNAGDFPTAHARLEEGLACWRARGDDRGIAHALNDIALLLLNYGHRDVAERYLAEALALYEAHGNRLGESRVWTERGGIALSREDLASAWRCFARALELVRPLPYPLHLGFVLTYLGVTEIFAAAPDAAWEHLTEALRLRRDEQELHGIGYSLLALAALANRRDQPERAALLCGAAEGCLAQVGAAVVPIMQALYDRELPTLLAKFPDHDAFARAFAAGRALPLAEAIAHALVSGGTS